MEGVQAAMNTSHKLLLVVNTADFFLSHRLEIALAAKAKGFEVHVATAQGEFVKEISQHGFAHHVVNFSRSGSNPFQELMTFRCLLKLFKQIQPDLVHLVTIKPVLYGGLAARLSGVAGVVYAISGLGTVFTDSSSILTRLRRRLVSAIYTASLGHTNKCVIVQNKDDEDKIINIAGLAEREFRLIPGSGVKLDKYNFLPEAEGPLKIVFAARLLKQKGVLEFVEASKILSNRGVVAKFSIAGNLDSGNPHTVTQRDINEWLTLPQVEVLGFQEDVAKLYNQAHIVCLPSFYGEGLPKSLIEAAACGRPIVTTDMPGCRDAVLPGKTGLLVPPKNPQALANALERLIKNPTLRNQMGIAARTYAEQHFDLKQVVHEHLEIYQSLLLRVELS